MKCMKQHLPIDQKHDDSPTTPPGFQNLLCCMTVKRAASMPSVETIRVALGRQDQLCSQTSCIHSMYMACDGVNRPKYAAAPAAPLLLLFLSRSSSSSCRQEQLQYQLTRMSSGPSAPPAPPPQAQPQWTQTRPSSAQCLATQAGLTQPQLLRVHEQKILQGLINLPQMLS